MKIYEQSLSGWGRYPVLNCKTTDVFYPLNDITSFHEQHSFTLRGLGRSYGDASLGTDNSLVIQTQGLNKMLSFDKKSGVISALAGVTLEEIIETVVPHGWFLPVCPGTRFVTLGGAVASNIHGKNHHHTGAINRFVQELEIITEKGPCICSPSKNTDLLNATCGGLGQTGFIQSVTLNLKKIETAYIKARLIKVKNFEEAIHVSKDLDSQYEHAVAWLDGIAKGSHMGRGILMLGNHAELCNLPDSKKKHPLKNEWKRIWTLPPVFPEWLLNSTHVGLFNSAYYHKMIGNEQNHLLNFETWFFPLDILSNWNRLYGKKGFIQYQFVIPAENAEKGIKQVLECLAKNKLPYFLAVLKRVREDNVSLPFAVPGFTLALDISLKYSHVFNVLNELDSLVLDNGGRLYLTKDARLSPATFRKMVPEYESWVHVVRKYNPNKKFASLLSKRLEM
ncbi:MAG: FAD-binding oxidoreductase [Candidatus Aureabacteria bacterium]|nr:FAD-binding oxidoreductase [Candidatus Auribacterota bacterium]